MGGNTSRLFRRLNCDRSGSADLAPQTSDGEDAASNDEGPTYNASSGRRKSVFAEAYDPEEDEGDMDVTLTVHPKSDAQRRSLKESVKNILLFRSLDPEQLNEVLDAMFERSVQPGDCIIEQGDDGDNFYVIDYGNFDIFVSTDSGQEKKVGSYSDSGSFGELALMYNMPRAATIKATSKGGLWAMDRATFRRIVLRAAFQKRKMYESLLEKVPLLTSLSAYERMSLADALISRTYGQGEAIVKQGDSADGMYFVEEGEVKISARAGNETSEKELTTISNGGYFGELALVTHKPRAATATAMSTTCRLAFLDVAAFERLLGPCMEVMRRNIQHYEEQLASIFGAKISVAD